MKFRLWFWRLTAAEKAERAGGEPRAVVHDGRVAALGEQPLDKLGALARRAVARPPLPNHAQGVDGLVLCMWRCWEMGGGGLDSMTGRGPAR